jgi:hypothetical protein
VTFADGCPRVKSQLQCSRVLGDTFLKNYEVFMQWFQAFDRPPVAVVPRAVDFRPYVSADPQQDTDTLAGAAFLILATDGLWDHVSEDWAIQLVANYILLNPREGVAQHLLEHSLKRAAFLQFDGTTVSDLKALSPGDERRQVHDDITVVVIFFGEDNETDKKTMSFSSSSSFSTQSTSSSRSASASNSPFIFSGETLPSALSMIPSEVISHIPPNAVSMSQEVGSSAMEDLYTTELQQTPADASHQFTSLESSSADSVSEKNHGESIICDDEPILVALPVDESGRVQLELVF